MRTQLFTQEKLPPQSALLSAANSDRNWDEDRGGDLIRLFQSESGPHCDYILNADVIKTDWEVRYFNVKGGDYKFIMPPETAKYFPDPKRFSIETLDWEPIKITQNAPPRADAPGALQKLWNSARPVPQSRPIAIEEAFIEYPCTCAFGKLKLLGKAGNTPNVRKVISEHIKRCEYDIRDYMEREETLVEDALDDYSVFDENEFCAYSSSARCARRLAYRTDERGWRSLVPLCDLHVQWMTDIDRTIMEVYNQKGQPAEGRRRFVRHRLAALANTVPHLVGTLVLRRLVWFCKVCAVVTTSD